MYIKQIKLTNIRAVKTLDIPPNGDDLPLQSILIGGNSTCKTTILRCVAIGLCNKASASALLSELPGSMVGSQSNIGTIEIKLKTPGRRRDISIITTLQRQQLEQIIDSSERQQSSDSMIEDQVIEKKYYYKWKTS